LGPSSLPVVVASLTKDMQTEQLLCWSRLTDTEHSTTSSSNEENLVKLTWQINVLNYQSKQRFIKFINS